MEVMHYRKLVNAARSRPACRQGRPACLTQPSLTQPCLTQLGLVLGCLMLATLAPAQTPPPPAKIAIFAPSPSTATKTICISADSPLISIVDGQTLITATALQDDFLCPGDTVVTPLLEAFSIREASVSPGSAFNIDWTINMNGIASTECVVSAPDVIESQTFTVFGTSTKQIPVLATAPASATPQTVTMRCANGATEKTATILITTQTTSVDCSNNLPPDKTSQDMDSKLFSDIYKDLISPPQWPGLDGNSRRITIFTNKYKALQFTAGVNPAPNGNTEMTEWATGPGASGLLLISISPCPGDFSGGAGFGFISDPQACREPNSNGFPSQSPNVFWHMQGTKPKSPQIPSCELISGQTYFFNLIFGKPSDPSTSTCTDSSLNPPRCTTNFTPRF